MIVELFGLTGSGKSTIAGALESEGYITVRINSRLELLYLNIKFFLRFPIRNSKNLASYMQRHFACRRRKGTDFPSRTCVMSLQNLIKGMSVYISKGE